MVCRVSIPLCTVSGIEFVFYMVAVAFARHQWMVKMNEPTILSVSKVIILYYVVRVFDRRSDCVQNYSDSTTISNRLG